MFDVQLVGSVASNLIDRPDIDAAKIAEYCALPASLSKYPNHIPEELQELSDKDPLSLTKNL